MWSVEADAYAVPAHRERLDTCYITTKQTPTVNKPNTTMPNAIHIVATAPTDWDDAVRTKERLA